MNSCVSRKRTALEPTHPSHTPTAFCRLDADQPYRLRRTLSRDLFPVSVPNVVVQNPTGDTVDCNSECDQRDHTSRVTRVRPDKNGFLRMSDSIAVSSAHIFYT